MIRISLIALFLIVTANASFAAGVNVLFRRGTAQAWTAANPVLQNGEPGFETDTGLIKIGNGLTTWPALPYYTSTSPAQPDPTVTRLYIDCTSGMQTVNISGYATVAISKTDNTANTITIIDSTPRNVPYSTVSIQNETARMVRHLNAWYVE